MSEDKKPKMENVPTGYVIVEFLKDHGTYKKGDKAEYHSSTAEALAGKKAIVKVVEKLSKMVPKQANK